jgi:predicted porin
VKVWGGELKGVLGYSHADRDYNGSKAQVYQAGIGYKYPLSKRTDLYAGAGFLRAKAELKGKETTGNSRSAFAGICHSF